MRALQPQHWSSENRFFIICLAYFYCLSLSLFYHVFIIPQPVDSLIIVLLSFVYLSFCPFLGHVSHILVIDF